MLQETSVASIRSSAFEPVAGWCPSRTRNPLTSRPFSSAGGCFLYVVSGVIAPDPSPATAVTILNTDPGTYRPRVARGNNGWVGSAWRSSNVLRAVLGSAMAEASYVGVDASARTSPVVGSSITTAPRRLPSAATAARWRSYDRDSVRSFG